MLVFGFILTSIPQTIHANIFLECKKYVDGACAIYDYVSSNPGTLNPFNGVGQFIDKTTQFLIVAILLAIPIALAFIAWIIATGAGLIFAYAIGIISGWQITNQTAFLSGWTATRDFANMLIVLALIGVAVATILRFRDYEAKKLLPGLIVIALLINFSGVLIGLIIDTSNIAFKTLTNASLDKIIMDNINPLRGAAQNQVIEIFNDVGTFDTGGLITRIIGVINILIFVAMAYFMMGAMFFYFSFLFIIRFAILAILFVLSPLAFVFRVFPIDAAKKLWNEWWQHFLKWSFVGIGLALSLFLATEIIKSPIVALPNNYTTLDATNQSKELLKQIAVAVIILGVGIRIAIKSGTPFANLAMGLAKATAGLAIGAVTGGASLAAGSAAKIAGATKAAQAVMVTATSLMDNLKYGATRAGEAIGLNKQGTANKAYRDKMAVRMKPYEALAKAEVNPDVVAERAMNSTSSAERSAYVNRLYEIGKLSKIKGRNAAETSVLRQQAVNDAKTHGIDTDEFAKKDYRYAEFDTGPKGAVTRIAQRIKAQNTKARQLDPRVVLFTNDQILKDARKAAKQEQLEANLSSMSGEQRRNIDTTDITPELVTSRSFTANMVRNFQTADRDHINTLRDNAMRQAIKGARRAAPSTAEKNRLRNILKEIEDLPHLATQGG